MKYKLRRIGNSLGVIIPKSVITDYKEGDEIELVITKQGDEVITKNATVPGSYNIATQSTTSGAESYNAKFNTKWCSKHEAMKGTCGCK